MSSDDNWLRNTAFMMSGKSQKKDKDDITIRKEQHIKIEGLGIGLAN